MRGVLLDCALWPLVRYSRALAHRLNIAVPRTVEGVRLRIPFFGGVGRQHLRVGPKDAALYRMVRHLLPRTPGAVVDVGCNIGHFMELCLLVDRSRRYLGFDPNLACCYYLERFIRLNRLPAHTVFPIGLSDRFSVMELRSNGQFDVSASLSREAHWSGKYASGGMVVTERGDAVLGELDLDAIAFVKIDVEGLELQTLRGLSRTIERHRPYLIFEVLIYAQLAVQQGERAELARVAAHRRETALAIEKYLAEHDYVVYKMHQSGELEYRATLDPGECTDSIAMDHLALPREKAAAVLADFPGRIDRMPEEAAAA